MAGGLSPGQEESVQYSYFPWTLVDRPTQLICTDMSTYNGKRHSRVICYLDVRSGGVDFSCAPGGVPVDGGARGVLSTAKDERENAVTTVVI